MSTGYCMETNLTINFILKKKKAYLVCSLPSLLLIATLQSVSLLRMGGVLTRQKWIGEKGMTEGWLERKPFYYLPSFLNIPRYCYRRREQHPWSR